MVPEIKNNKTNVLSWFKIFQRFLRMILPGQKEAMDIYIYHLNSGDIIGVGMC